jgi:hypothetical protein
LLVVFLFGLSWKIVSLAFDVGELRAFIYKAGEGEDELGLIWVGVGD